jgi:ankyrin repeat protein
MLRHSIVRMILVARAVMVVSGAIAEPGEEPSAYDRLHDAIERGDLGETQSLAKRFPATLEEGSEHTNMEGNNWRPRALEHAIRNDDQMMVRMLLKCGSEVKPKNATAVLCFVKSAGMAQLLVDAGADLEGGRVEFRHRLKITPLHIARDASIAKVLLSAGAKLNVVDEFGDTPLSTAIKRQRISVAELLLEHGAKVEISDVAALTEACRHGELEIAQKLLDQGVSVGSERGYGNDTFQAACEGGNPKLVELLINRGEKPTAGNQHFDLPVLCAAGTPLRKEMKHHDQVAILKLLRDSGVKLDVCDDAGNTLLHLAAKAGNPDTVKFLLASGLKVDERNKVGHTPLHLAAMVTEPGRGFGGDAVQHAAVAELLLLSGASPTSQVKVTTEVMVLSKDGESIETTDVTETFTPSRYAASRRKWSAYEGEIDASPGRPRNESGFFFLQGATKETNARIAKAVENGNRAREAVGEVLRRFGAE